MKRALVVLVILLLPSAALFIFRSWIRVPPGPVLIPVPSPAPEGARFPRLDVSDSRSVHMSWVEQVQGGGHALRFSKLSKDGWGAPRTIAKGSGWFVNWADFPSLVASSDQLLMAHWLVRSGSGTYAYDIALSFSTDAGQTWAEPVAPHRDGVAAEHGFLSAQPWEGGFALAWLDGRNSTKHGGAMSLYFTTLDPVAGPAPEVELDNRVCDCCQTAMGRIPGGLLVAYRDRSLQEIRDISMIRLQAGHWSQPTSVSRDGWQIDGCPVNGPALATQGEAVGVAWYTEADDQPRVLVALSRDAGKTFAEPVRIDEGNPSGRVDLAFAGDGGMIASWLEVVDNGTERFQLRRVAESGPGKVVTVAEGDFSRAAGFPQMLVRGDDVVLAWTDVQENATNVKTAFVRVASLAGM